MKISTGLVVCFIFILLLGAASCCERDVRRNLSDIESYIENRPDSALVSIRQIDTSALLTKAIKGVLKYSRRIQKPK